VKSGSPAPNASSTALAPLPQAKPNVWDDVRYQQLWLATQKKPWRSLAVVGASPDLDTVGVAELLSKIAWWYRGEPSCVFDLRDASLRLVEYQVHEIAMQVDAGLRVILALRSIGENPTAIPLARAADAVVLCVGLGKTELKAAEKTIEQIGRDRVLGCIVEKSIKSPASGKAGGEKKANGKGGP
jgi:hypothetical protein